MFRTRSQAILKPFGGQLPNACAHYQQDMDETLTHEVVAWRLAHALGGQWEQMVPAAVFRDVPGVGPGVLLNYRDGSPDVRVFQDGGAQVFAAAFWDALIGQQDRHAKNFRYDAVSRRLALIDNAFAFARPGNFLNDSSFLAYRIREHRQPISQPERDALDALLSSGDLLGLREFLSEDRADALEARAATMQRCGLLPIPGAF